MLLYLWAVMALRMGRKLAALICANRLNIPEAQLTARVFNTYV